MVNFWPTVSVTAGLLVNFGHALSVGLLVRHGTAMAVPATTALNHEVK